MRPASLALVAALVLGVTPASAQRRSTEPPTIVLNAPATARSADAGWPRLGDHVTFSATFPRQLESRGVRVQVLCYQDGQLVFGTAGPYDNEFLLGGAMSQWYITDGAATCVADLYYWSYNGGQKFNWLASTNFEAAGR